MAKSSKVKQYYDLQRHWTRKIVPHLNDKALNEILVRDFNRLTRRHPRFWSYVKHGSCHGIANFALRLAQLAEPHRAWKIVTSREHSTVWDGQNTLFEFNLLALGVSVDNAWKMAAKGKGSKVLPIGQEKQVPFAQHFPRNSGKRARVKRAN